MSAEATVATPRQEFMKGEGFIFYHDVIERLLDMQLEKPAPSFPRYEHHLKALQQDGATANSRIPDSLFALHVICAILREDVPAPPKTTSAQRETMFEVTSDEVNKASPITYDMGLDDLDFPWQFTPGVSASLVHDFVKEGHISQEEVKAILLEDWAAMIESDWFCDLMEEFGRTGWGVLNAFGRLHPHLNPDSFKKMLLSQAVKYAYPESHTLGNVDLYRTYKDESKTGLASLGATITPEWHAALRYMRQNNRHRVRKNDRKTKHTPSDGCPVGREFAWIPQDYEATMPRAVRLRDIGRVLISDKPNKEGMVLVSLNGGSGIKRATQFLAGQIYSFTWYHGVQAPVLTR